MSKLPVRIASQALTALNYSSMILPVERRSDKANPSLNASQSEALRTFNMAERTTLRSREKLDAFLATPAFKALEGADGFFTDAARETFLARFTDQNRQILARHDIDLLGPQNS